MQRLRTALVLLASFVVAAAWTTNGPVQGRTSAAGAARLAARVLQVGPSRTYKVPSQAAPAAQDGDTIEIDAGVYSADWAQWNANNLTIRSVGGVAQLRSSGLIANGKAIWVIRGNNTLVENIEFSGARVADQNGAGIRQEGDGLTIRSCFFHDNENGILGGGSANSEVLIEYSEFANNGFGDGYSHNIYIGAIRKFTLQYSYSHGALVGHEVKTRALENYILYNRIMDEVDGTASYTVDIPNGGTSYLIGNLLQQGPDTQNPTIVSYAAEGGKNPDQHLYVVNNTLVNDRPSGGTFLNVYGSVPAVMKNNIFVGAGTAYNGPGSPSGGNNLITSNAGLVDRARFDYHLVAGSAAIDAGADPGSANGFNLAPAYQYLHPHDKSDRTTVGSLDLGAYEYIPTPPVGARARVFLPLVAH